MFDDKKSKERIISDLNEMKNDLQEDIDMLATSELMKELEELEEIDTAVNALPANEREAILLRFFEGGFQFLADSRIGAKRVGTVDDASDQAPHEHGRVDEERKRDGAGSRNVHHAEEEDGGAFPCAESARGHRNGRDGIDDRKDSEVIDERKRNFKRLPKTIGTRDYGEMVEE